MLCPWVYWLLVFSTSQIVFSLPSQDTTTTVTDAVNACLAMPSSSFAQATETLCNAGCMSDSDAATAVPPYLTSGPDPSADVRERAVFDDWHMNKKRAKPSAIPKLGDCVLNPPPNSPLTLPGWPRATPDVLNPEIAGNLKPQYSTMSRYDRASSSDCVFTTSRVNAKDFSNAPHWQDSRGRDWNNANNIATLDHACQ